MPKDWMIKMGERVKFERWYWKSNHVRELLAWG
jgi:hypothetical protein